MAGKSTFAGLLLGFVALATLSGCSSVSYYSQSVIGHTKLMLARQPVAKVMEAAPAELRSKLELSISLKQFAEAELGLDNNHSYTQYVELDREFPVWNVVAAPEFSVQAKQWCYPVIGCASYRGYFKLESAKKYANRMSNNGYETLVSGAVAYSTLGWFSDPILPSMLRHGDVDFAETLFHELAHQRLYVNGDSDFNEAFATVVGEVGAQRWLAQYRPQELSHYNERLRAVADFNRLISDLKDRLNIVYESTISASHKRDTKNREFARFEADYQQLKAIQWRGRGWFDRWFERPINNARLAAFSTYYELVPPLTQLLAQCENNFELFFQVLSNVKKMDGRVSIPSHCDAS